MKSHKASLVNLSIEHLTLNCVCDTCWSHPFVSLLTPFSGSSPRFVTRSSSDLRARDILLHESSSGPDWPSGKLWCQNIQLSFVSWVRVFILSVCLSEARLSVFCCLSLSLFTLARIWIRTLSCTDDLCRRFAFYLQINAVTTASDTQFSLHGKRLTLDADRLSCAEHLGPSLVLVSHVAAALRVRDFKMRTISGNKRKLHVRNGQKNHKGCDQFLCSALEKLKGLVLEPARF